MSKTLAAKNTNNSSLQPFFYNYPFIDMFGSSIFSPPTLTSKNRYVSRKSIETNCHYELYETDKEISLNIYLPKEESKENVSIEFEHSKLKINIECSKKEEKDVNLKTNIPEKMYLDYIVNNSNYEIDGNLVSAKLDKNVLFVTMPKKNMSKRIMID